MSVRRLALMIMAASEKVYLLSIKEKPHIYSVQSHFTRQTLFTRLPGIKPAATPSARGNTCRFLSLTETSHVNVISYGEFLAVKLDTFDFV
jgi:hypothetical protein